jgi:hypothetical protein
MTFVQIPLQTCSFWPPAYVNIVASFDTIVELGLDEWDGEHIDRLRGVIGMDVDASHVTFECARTLEAWKDGEENAGRGTWRLPRPALAAVYIDENTTRSTL